MTDDRACSAIRGPWAGTSGHLDAPFRPTPEEVVERMMDMAGVGPGDFLIDLGCGDGRIVVAAARRGARALGVDIDPERIAQSEAAAREADVADRVAFRCEDLFATRLESASVVSLYLLSLPNQLLAPRLQTELAPGSRVVSYCFSLPDWTPDIQDAVGHNALLRWTVPART